MIPAMAPRYKLILVLSGIASLFSACYTGPAKQHTSGGPTRLHCDLSGTVAGVEKDCRCHELNGRNDTVSEGVHRIGSTGQPLFRKGWHTFYSGTGIVRVHYTGIQDHADSAFRENANQTIHISRSGDTLFKQSTYVEIQAAGRIRLGSALTCRFRYSTPKAFDSIEVATIVTRAHENNNVTLAERRHYGAHQFKRFTATAAPTEPGSYIMHGLLYTNSYGQSGDRIPVATTFFDHPFVVVP